MHHATGRACIGRDIKGLPQVILGLHLGSSLCPQGSSSDLRLSDNPLLLLQAICNASQMTASGDMVQTSMIEKLPANGTKVYPRLHAAQSGRPCGGQEVLFW